MNFGLLLFVILQSIIGILVILYVMLSLIGMIVYKIHRKIKYHASLYD